MRRFLRATLVAHGFRVIEAETAAAAEVAAASHNPELVLLDLGLPDGDGIELTRAAARLDEAPIIVISARGREEDKVRRARRRRRRLPDQAVRGGRAAGAHPGRAAPRGAARRGAREARARIGELRDRLRAPRGGRRRARGAGSRRSSSSCSRCWRGTPAGCVTHRQILSEVWGPTHAQQTHTVRVHMAELRKKIEADPRGRAGW